MQPLKNYKKREGNVWWIINFFCSYPYDETFRFLWGGDCTWTWIWTCAWLCLSFFELVTGLGGYTVFFSGILNKCFIENHIVSKKNQRWMSRMKNRIFCFSFLNLNAWFNSFIAFIDRRLKLSMTAIILGKHWVGRELISLTCKLMKSVSNFKSSLSLFIHLWYESNVLFGLGSSNPDIYLQKIYR